VGGAAKAAPGVTRRARPNPTKAITMDNFILLSWTFPALSYNLVAISMTVNNNFWLFYPRIIRLFVT
jgi:hypothetical protein